MIVKRVAKDDSGLAQQSIAAEAPPAASHQVPASSQDTLVAIALSGDWEVNNDREMDDFVLLVHGAGVHIQGSSIIGHAICLVNVSKDVYFWLDVVLDGSE